MSWPRHSRTNLSHSKKQVLVTPDNQVSLSTRLGRHSVLRVEEVKRGLQGAVTLSVRKLLRHASVRRQAAETQVGGRSDACAKSGGHESQEDSSENLHD